MNAGGPTDLHQTSLWSENIRRTTQTLVVPQGFTLTVAGVFAALIGHLGYPGLVAVWLFVLGAGLGFSLLTLASGAHRGDSSRPLSIVGLALLNLAPAVVVPTVIAVSWPIANRHLAFLVAGFSAVTLYIVVLAGYLAAVDRTRRRLRGHGRGRGPQRSGRG